MSWRVVLLTLLITVSLCPLTSALKAEDQPQWGERYTRNMVSSETDLPVHFDPSTGQGIKWSAPLGTRSYSTPVVSSGRVILGANNDDPRDPRHQGDRGVLLCLDEQDGSLLWQLVVPKLQGDPYLDQPHYGICSPATVEGDRVYIVTNRAEVLCLDLHGQANGNDGPYLDEGRHMSPEGPAADGSHLHRCRHHLAVRHAGRDRNAPARLGPQFHSARRSLPVPEHGQR